MASGLTEIVGEIRRHGTEVCLGRILECLSQIHAAGADDGKPRYKGRVKAGAADEDVDFVRHSVGGNKAFFGDLRYGGKGHVALVTCDGLEVAVVWDRPLVQQVSVGKSRFGKTDKPPTLQPTAKLVGMSFSASSGWFFNLDNISFLENCEAQKRREGELATGSRRGPEEVFLPQLPQFALLCLG